MSRVIAFACDHAGVDLKTALISKAASLGFAVEDLGPHTTDSVDYPDYAHRLCHWVQNDASRSGVLICGSGIGMSIAANRHEQIRAALCHNIETATLCRQHNDANVLCIGARMVSEDTALACLEAFLKTAFEGGRHARRLDKINALHKEPTE